MTRRWTAPELIDLVLDDGSYESWVTRSGRVEPASASQHVGYGFYCEHMTDNRSPLAAGQEFFEGYAAALLARDEKAVATRYAVPSLILFPGSSILVTEADQTEKFFAASWTQYEGVTAVDHEIAVMGHAPGSIWVDVTWSYDDQARERFCYQLVAGSEGHQIAVLRPMALNT